MKSRRPECSTAKDWSHFIPDATALLLIEKAVAKRRGLIYGKLDDADGSHCALGCFWADNPGTSLNQTLIEEVAAVNDAVSARSTPKARWQFVRRWLRIRLKNLGDKP